MKCCISIGTIDKNILFLIIGGIFKCLINILLIKTDFVVHPLIICIGSSFGMSLSFILLIIYKRRTKKKAKQKIQEKSKNQLELIYNNQYEEIKRDKYKYILLTSFFDFLITISISTFCHDVKINSWIFDILFLSLFSHKFLKNNIYRHHYISIIIIIIAGIILDVSLGNYAHFINEIIPNTIKFVTEIIFCLGIVINKYTMVNTYASEYEICTYQGLFGLIIYIIIFILSKYISFFKRFDSNFEYNSQNILIFFAVVIFQLIYNLSILFTINHTTTCHFLIIMILGFLSRYFIKLYDGNDNSILLIIVLLFILFMTLIFNEIIELNFCGLSHNTKKNIALRANKEKGIMLADLSNDSLYSEHGSEPNASVSVGDHKRQFSKEQK